MNRAEVYALVSALLIGISFACLKPSIVAFIGWPTGTIGVTFALLATTRISG